MPPKYLSCMQKKNLPSDTSVIFFYSCHYAKIITILLITFSNRFFCLHVLTADNLNDQEESSYIFKNLVLYY